MENNFRNRDFEQFVKQNADQYRMFPSEKVWKNIHHTLHTRNRWYGVGLALLLLTAVTVTWVMLIPANKNQSLADKLPVNTSASIIAKNDIPANAASGEIVQPSIIQNRKAEPRQNLFIAELGTPVDEYTSPVAENNSTESEMTATITERVNTTPDHVTSNIYIKNEPNRSNDAPVSVKAIPVMAMVPVKSSEPVIADNTEIIAKTDAAVESAVQVMKDANLMTIESVVNSYTFQPKKNKFSLRAYFTPTISYRKLKEDNPFIAASRSSATPVNSTLTISDVNEVVTHKPDIGLQLGVSAGFPVSRRLTFVSGLQFNVSKYDIQAYEHPSETATIALMSGTVSTESTHRNIKGGRDASWLSNLYFSASLPVGMELRLSGNNKTEIGIGGTFQPTYVLGNRAYLISTDYKNYAEIPSLVRKWNMSTSIEAFAGYSTGKLNWRIGPQVRYQLLSSFREKYPVKERLFDYGLKVGITLNK